MNTDLNAQNLIPLSQPYNIAPWYYNGSETVSIIPSPNITDWVLVELLKPTGSGFKEFHVVARKTGFLFNDGTIRNTDGISMLDIPYNVYSDLFVRILHRNHISVLSKDTLIFNNGNSNYDFTVDTNVVFGGYNAVTQLATGIWGMMAGEGNNDGQIDNLDKDEIWLLQQGLSGYLSGDYNLDGQVDTDDEILTWEPNSGKGVLLPIRFNCGDLLIDQRDGKHYLTKLIGRQCWMAENLNIGNMIQGNNNMIDDGLIEKYCYDNNVDNCNNYGGLYQWDEMMQYDTNRFVQGVCPEGWHLPTSEEYISLFNEFGGIATAGDSLKVGGISGFNALMSGYRNENGTFSGLNNESYFWTSVAQGSNSQYHSLSQAGPSIVSGNAESNKGYSVRCIKGFAPILNSNVVIIDSNIYTLISDSLELSQGIYKFLYPEKKLTEEIIVGDIIVGTTGNGYLRRVLAVVNETGWFSIYSEHAGIEDIWQQIEFALPLFSANLQQNDPILDRVVNMFTAVDIPGIYIMIENATISLKGAPMFSYAKWKSRPAGMFSFTFEGILEQQLTVGVVINDAITDFEEVIALPISYSYHINKANKIYGVPIIGNWNIRFNVRAHVNTLGPISYTLPSSSENQFQGSVYYQQGEDIGGIMVDKILNNDPPEFQASWSDATINISLGTMMEFKFEDVGGPFIYLIPEGQIIYHKQPPSNDFDACFNQMMYWAQGISNAEILGNSIPNCVEIGYPYNELVWQTPYKITQISGNDQTGPPNQQLPEPLKVKVTDNKENSATFVAVHFEVVEGGGSLSEYEVMTDENGFAQTSWTLGVVPGTQTVKAIVRKADGSEITGSPVIFNATQNSPAPCPGIPTVTYGTQTYNTIQIGSQCWFKENLNIGNKVSSLINQTNNSVIEKYCYQSSTANCNTYGGLYQWNEMMQYTTTPGSQGICPAGWHIPTNLEWTTLIEYLGGSSVAGGKMKEIGLVHWYSPNTGATNSSGFTALPGGQHNHGSSDTNLGMCGYLWSSSEYNTTLSYFLILGFESPGITGPTMYYKNWGFSVRCLKN